MSFRQLRMPSADTSLPSCINWKWIDITTAGSFTAHYCYEGKCIELGEFKSADSANFAVLKEIRRCINTGVSRLVDD